MSLTEWEEFYTINIELPKATMTRESVDRASILFEPLFQYYCSIHIAWLKANNRRNKRMRRHE